MSVFHRLLACRKPASLAFGPLSRRGREGSRVTSLLNAEGGRSPSRHYQTIHAVQTRRHERQEDDEEGAAGTQSDRISTGDERNPGPLLDPLSPLTLVEPGWKKKDETVLICSAGSAALLIDVGLASTVQETRLAQTHIDDPSGAHARARAPWTGRNVSADR
ncbi:hypothetical protein LX36DRAFT_717467 [Colletotrichum falcatum]|nr:hypothetical protein LX36DRAFT_717467 [Colletotrichum falcatum]